MQRQAMGVALHIVLLPFLNYCIAQFDSYDADLIKSAFFCLLMLTGRRRGSLFPSVTHLLRLTYLPSKRKRRCIICIKRP
nr:hypothetical protein [Cronobacter turicensis]